MLPVVSESTHFYLHMQRDGRKRKEKGHSVKIPISPCLVSSTISYLQRHFDCKQLPHLLSMVSSYIWWWGFSFARNSSPHRSTSSNLLRCLASKCFPWKISSICRMIPAYLATDGGQTNASVAVTYRWFASVTRAHSLALLLLSLTSHSVDTYSLCCTTINNLLKLLVKRGVVSSAIFLKKQFRCIIVRLWEDCFH